MNKKRTRYIQRLESDFINLLMKNENWVAVRKLPRYFPEERTICRQPKKSGSSDFIDCHLGTKLKEPVKENILGSEFRPNGYEVDFSKKSSCKFHAC
jgi:hypothetical protein